MERRSQLQSGLTMDGYTASQYSVWATATLSAAPVSECFQTARSATDFLNSFRITYDSHVLRFLLGAADLRGLHRLNTLAATSYEGLTDYTDGRHRLRGLMYAQRLFWDIV